jgi:hypothetical protein
MSEHVIFFFMTMDIILLIALIVFTFCYMHRMCVSGRDALIGFWWGFMILNFISFLGASQ